MARLKLFIVFIQLIVSFCLCELNDEKKVKLLNGFIAYYNSLPNQIYKCDEGYLLSAQQTDITNAFDLQVSLKVSETHDIDVTKYLKCTVTVADVDVPAYQDQVVVMRHQCQDDLKRSEDELPVTETVGITETHVSHKHIQLDNELQTGTAVTSGEQFIAVPREEPKRHCMGCSSYVDPQAEGVRELAAIGIRQLNLLKPNTQHSLNNVLDVERQVQVVNGIRYILTLLVDYNSCSTPDLETCAYSNVCKITILEKPWMKLPDGSKYKAILSNNCTDEWQFGDDGVVVPGAPNGNREGSPIVNSKDIIKPVYVEDIQSSQQTERALTDQDVKNIEEQIIPHNENNPVLNLQSQFDSSVDKPLESKDHVVKIELESLNSPNAIPTSNRQKVELLDEDKKKAIDGLLNFFNFPDLDTFVNLDEVGPRIRRSSNTEEKLNKANYDKTDIGYTELFMTGAPKKLDPNELKYKQLAEESMNKYLLDSGTSVLHKLVNVNEVTVQVVAGRLTKIRFTIAPITASSGDEVSCTTSIWEKPWENFKEIKVNCGDKDTGDGDSKIVLKRNKRSSGNALGSPVERDPNDLRFKQFAQESLEQYLNESSISQPHKVLFIEKVTEKTVAGTLTEINFQISPSSTISELGIKCLSTIWVKEWLDFKEIKVKCQNSTISRVRRSILLGGIKEQEPNNPKYRLLAEQSLRKYLSLQGSGNKTSHEVIRIDRVYTQEVSGIKTTIFFVIAQKDTTEVINCTSVVFQKPWLNNTEINVDCDETMRTTRSIRSVDHLIGGIHSQDASKPEYKELAQESLNKFRKHRRNLKNHVVAEVNKVTMQIVEGARYAINYTAAPKLCAGNINNCDDINAILDCHAVVIDRPYPRLKKIHVSCNPRQIITKSGLYRRDTEEDTKPNIENYKMPDKTLKIQPKDEHIDSLAQALASQALKHIEAKYTHPQKRKVVRIHSLEKQVGVDGHYRMKIEVGLTNCLALSVDHNCKLDKKGDSGNEFCKVKVWLRPLTDQPPNIRVTCDNDGAMSESYPRIQAQYLFREFVAKYMPHYTDDLDEMSKRFDIFRTNIDIMHQMNVHERGTATYGVTRFADLSHEEFTTKHLGLKTSLADSNQMPMRKAVIPTGEIPEKFDWRDTGAVTPVKDQGSCGSCWAFSVTGNIEGQWKLKSGSLVSLSEQELVDCDTMDSGCNGGLPDNAYRAIEQLGGLESESDYPYEGEDDKCSFNRTLSRVRISGAVNITSNETDMAKWLVANGPISIGINANAMQFYMGGVSHPWKMLCSPSNLDHGVLIVGYGIKDYPLFKKKLPYWIVKNSWGPGWGEQGYYRVFRGDGTCGLNQMASSALI